MWLWRFLKASMSLLKQAWISWNEDNAFRLAAALAYYAVFSLAPLLIIAIAIAGYFFGGRIAEGEVLDQMKTVVGASGAQAIQTLLHNARSGPMLGASWIGVASLIFGATGVFVSLQDGLNTVWQVKPRPTNVILGFLRQRLHTFTLVLGVGFLLLISLLISAAISGAAKYLNHEFGLPVVWQGVNSIISFVIVFLLFAMIFKMLPDVDIRWTDVWTGAAFTAALFTFGKFAIGMYLGRSSFSSVYGAAGSLVVILAWVYYSSLILFFGAEMTRVYADRYGRHLRPKRNAEPLTPEHRAQQGLEPGKAA